MKQLLLLLTLALTIVACKKETKTFNDPIPKHDSLTISSKFVNENRVINIWTPPRYEVTADSFPVLYMPDGGVREDFPHIANTLAELIADNKVPPMILVGIENTERARDLTGYSEAEYDKQCCPLTDGAKDFRAFITQELMPEINKKYRTTDRKGIIGESLAGLFVMETFFKKPASFNFYIAMDPSLWWNNHFLVENVESYLSKFPKERIKLWFAGSDAKDISQYTKMMRNAIVENAPKSLEWKYSDEPQEKHNTIFRATKEKALIWALNN